MTDGGDRFSFDVPMDDEMSNPAIASHRRLGDPGFGRRDNSNRQGVITSTGRTAPTLPQTIASSKANMMGPPQSVDYERGVFAEGEGDRGALGRQKLMAPKGRFVTDEHGNDPYGPRVGEWALYYDDSDTPGGLNLPASVSEMEPSVFTCWNGSPAEYSTRFAGIVTNAQDGPTGTNTSDRFGALNIAGTVSGHNDGPDTLTAGDIVCIGKPWMIDNGKGLVPAVTHVGTPSDKAFPGVYRLRWVTGDSAAIDAKSIVEGLFEKALDSGLDLTEFPTDAYLGKKLAVRDVVLSERLVFVFAVLHAHFVILSHTAKVLLSVAQRDPTKHTQSLKGSQLQKVLIAAQTYLLALEQRDQAVRRNYERFSKIVDFDYNPTPLNRLPSAAHLTGFHECLCLCFDIISMIDGFKATAITRINNLILSCRMGRVLAPSVSGEQLDVLLGVF